MGHSDTIEIGMSFFFVSKIIVSTFFLWNQKLDRTITSSCCCCHCSLKNWSILCSIPLLCAYVQTSGRRIHSYMGCLSKILFRFSSSFRRKYTTNNRKLISLLWFWLFSHKSNQTLFICYYYYLLSIRYSNRVRSNRVNDYPL